MASFEPGWLQYHPGFVIVVRYWDGGVSMFRNIKDFMSNEEEWLKCPTCARRPQLWIFDNGRYAKCICDDIGAGLHARAESVMSLYSRTGSTADYNVDDLKDRWNIYVKTGQIQHKLPEGQW
jgi:hypothetical protein